jgi:cytochrome bd-type quinol oxidase subunit 2
MSMVLIALAVIFYIVAFVGGIMVLIAAFKESALWGICSLLIPFVMLVFVITHWEASKKGFLLQVAGVVLGVLCAFGAAAMAASSVMPEIGDGTTITEPAS